MGCRCSKDVRTSKPINILKPPTNAVGKASIATKNTLVVTPEVDPPESRPRSRSGSQVEDAIFYDAMDFPEEQMMDTRSAEVSAITDLPNLLALEGQHRKDILRAEMTMSEAIASLMPGSVLTDISVTDIDVQLPEGLARPHSIPADSSPRSQEVQREVLQKFDQIRARFGWEHLAASEPFTEWFYGFLENKNYDVPETIAKLERKIALETDEFSKMPMTDSARKLLATGMIHKIGVALDGSDVLYVYTKRDFPTKKNLEERVRNFDVTMTYSGRYPYKGFTMLVNQDQASIWSNTDLPYGISRAIRISKFWPGAIKRIILVKMGTAVSAVIKPIIRSLPSRLGSKVMVLSDKDIKKGILETVLPPESIPEELGGLYTADNETSWKAYADTCFEHFKYFQMKRTEYTEKNQCIARTECEEARAKNSSFRLRKS